MSTHKTAQILCEGAWTCHHRSNIYFILNLSAKNNLIYGLSIPPLEKGLQRKMRQTDLITPKKTPYFSIDSTAYSEQVGINLQVGTFFSGETCL